MTSWQYRLRRQRLVLWGTLIVFFLQGLAWSGMPAYAVDADQDWVVICTGEGIKRISLTASGIVTDDSLQDIPASALADHCDLCVFAKSLNTGSDAIQILEAYTHIPASHVHTAKLLISDRQHSPQQPRAPPLNELS